MTVYYDLTAVSDLHRSTETTAFCSSEYFAAFGTPEGGPFPYASSISQHDSIFSNVIIIAAAYHALF
jgi:hypothetical protein